jgi:alkylhydroperoxidase/carboxymuconolactone decarboxylase family protein YurZ
MKTSEAFGTFIKEVPEIHQAFMEFVQKASKTSELDEKTGQIAYIAAMAAVGREDGLPFHVKMARSLGATRGEIISAVLVALPLVGTAVISSLPVAIRAFDEKDQ